MERKIDVDLIIWLVFLLLLFGGSLVKWLIHRFGRKKSSPELAEGGEETTPQEKSPTFMEEFKKMLEGMVLEERPEIVIVEERPHKRRPKHLKARVPKETAPVPQPVVKKEELITAPEVTLPMPRAPLVKVLSRDELQRAVVMSEILGPPRAR
ncbi:MAG: hypothetical protein ACK4WF_02205, partial [Candidatus Brocadiales bacterium]